MKYYARVRTDNSRFYIDENGNEVDEKTAQTNLQDKRPRQRVRIMESLSEFDALLRRPVVTEFDAAVRKRAEAARRRLPPDKTRLVEAWRKIGLSEEGAEIAAHVETDMRTSVKDWNAEDWAKFRW